MTIVETILGGLSVAIISSLLAAILSNKNKVTEDDFEEHKKDKNPHIYCAVHATRLGSMERKLDNIDGKLDKLLDRGR